MTKSIKEVENAIKNGNEAFYLELKIKEIKNNKIRLENDDTFFKPFLPAIKIKY